ncbi:MAG TPA: hypothetical protein VMS17_29575 [Gemmataceae bacterium]|nr:hypothetical protein [Gemmataceae bacterium]
MEESDTYLMILDQGQEKAFRRVILKQGEERLGPPDEAMKAGLNSISDLDRLERIALRTPKAVSWQEILHMP